MRVMRVFLAKEKGSTDAPFRETALPMESHDETRAIPFNCLQKENSAKRSLELRRGFEPLTC